MRILIGAVCTAIPFLGGIIGLNTSPAPAAACFFIAGANFTILLRDIDHFIRRRLVPQSP